MKGDPYEGKRLWDNGPIFSGWIFMIIMFSIPAGCCGWMFAEHRNEKSDQFQCVQQSHVESDTLEVRCEKVRKYE